jgi:hypothetical protein
MGILDDAIREHLDLKRRLGAEEDELKRLEGEAFGPPTRPGDPDFPDTDTGAQALVDDASGPDTSSELVAEPPSEELAAEAPATAEEPIAPAPPAEESATAGLFDHSADELDVDLDLDLDEPPASVEDVAADAPAAEPPAAPEPEPAPEPDAQGAEPPATAESPVEPVGEPPIESLDTVEHHFEGAIDDTGEAELVEGELDEAQPKTGEDDEEEDEDVLEETPEFLRDAPEDDELWFEQGEPKDFDF